MHMDVTQLAVSAVVIRGRGDALMHVDVTQQSVQSSLVGD